MKKFNIAQVTQSERLSPNMIRVRLRSDFIQKLPASAKGGHIKLVIPKTDQTLEEFSKFLGSFSVRKRMRTYTIRELNPESGEIDIDFVAHGDNGPASAWASAAQIGDFIALSHPGSPKIKRVLSDRYLVAVDMSAFPAAAAGIEGLPENSKGHLYAEILTAEDVQPINCPDGIHIQWVLGGDNDGNETSLIDAIRSHALIGDESIFVAGEHQTVGNLRKYFRDEQRYPKDQLYISSYWKQGLVETEHKRVKTLIA